MLLGLAACAPVTPVVTPEVTPVAEPAPEVVPEAAPEPQPEPKTVLSPADLKGLDRTALLGLLGEPDFRRADGPAHLWRYRKQDCRLGVYLYETGVDHLDARDANGEPVDLVACLAHF